MELQGRLWQEARIYFRAQSGSGRGVLKLHPFEPGIDRFNVEMFRIERTTNPVEHLFVILVFRIADGFEEFVVAGDSTAVVRWT